LTETHYYVNLDTNILYEGDARPSLGLGMVELNTVSQLFRVGRFTYSQPLHLWESASGPLTDFTTHFTFMIDTLNNSRWSDGFAFCLAPVGFPIPPNSAGGNLGLFNSSTNFVPSKNQIVMVEFDSFSNEWDPAVPHVGINVNKISSIVSTSWDFGSKRWKVANVWITYNATTKYLSVFWTYKENPNPAVIDSTFSLSHRIDLREVLPEWVTIGFSAATGVCPERHVISSWEFNSHLDSDETSKKTKDTERKKKLFIAATAGITLLVLMLGVGLRRLDVTKRMRKINGLESYSKDVITSINKDLEKRAFPKRFAYKELVAATNGFASNGRLGQGGSGHVYKGMLQDLGCAIAVKRIFAKSDYYEKIFINEVKIISRLIHRNLVQFIGWCHEEGECLLVYAYMPNSSLDTHLFGSKTTLQWDFRYKIALGLASALHYLHEDAEQCVLHRDIKSANVLLDKDFGTKLGDFGIAKLIGPCSWTQATGAVGTFGYIAPEYASGGKASRECDLFSFGVVALEIACGRRTYQDGELHMPLVSWVWQLYLAGNILFAADERLERKFDQIEMECLLIIGLWCTHPNNKERPKAGQVMKVLQLEASFPEPPHDMHESDHHLPHHHI
ncbi:L-type lectin-domain containing receptor kinase IX.1-like, partial [Pyrus communis]|uniref:L-type lectin-domain containing receptor kinase IX.1-like n=1 Tax=Pyrus communis TaxID=23211 RepID=UPI0035C11B8A